jgi:hypothetical protein
VDAGSARHKEEEMERMSERALVSRRGILAVAGGSVIGATAMSLSPANARADDRIVPNAKLINPQPIPPSVMRAHVAAAIPENDFGAFVVTRVPRYVLTGDKMIVMASVLVDQQFVGQPYTVRMGIQEDTGESRVEVQTDSAVIPSEAFTVQVSKGGNLPGDDWNLSSDRIFVMQSTFNVVKARAFAFAPVYVFKVLDA